MGNLEGKWVVGCKVQGPSAVSCAKTAEPIELLFGLRTPVGQRNHVLDCGADAPTRKGTFTGVSGPLENIRFRGIG